MMTNLFATIFSSLISAILAWMVSRHKSDAEIKKIKADTNAIELKNLSDMINIYKTISEDLKKEIEQLKVQMTAVKNENHLLRRDIMALKNKQKDPQP